MSHDRNMSMYDPEGHDMMGANARREGERAAKKRQACTNCFKHCECSACWTLWCGGCCSCPSFNCCADKLDEDGNKIEGFSCGDCCRKMLFCDLNCFYFTLQGLNFLCALANLFALATGAIEVFKNNIDIQELIVALGSIFVFFVFFLLQVMAAADAKIITTHFKFLDSWTGIGTFQILVSFIASFFGRSRELRGEQIDVVLLIDEDLKDPVTFIWVAMVVIGLFFIVFGLFGGKNLRGKNDEAMDSLVTGDEAVELDAVVASDDVVLTTE